MTSLSEYAPPCGQDWLLHAEASKLSKQRCICSCVFWKETTVSPNPISYKLTVKSEFAIAKSVRFGWRVVAFMRTSPCRHSRHFRRPQHETLLSAEWLGALTPGTCLWQGSCFPASLTLPRPVGREPNPRRQPPGTAPLPPEPNTHTPGWCWNSEVKAELFKV